MFEALGVFYRGVVLGVMIAAPVGPIGLLCIRRTLQRGLLIGLATGLGAACADTLFGAVAALGVAAILNFMKHYNVFIRMLGGALLLWGAWHTWRDRPEIAAARLKKPSKLAPHTLLDDARQTGWLPPVKAFLGSFAITVTNPVTIFAILAVVAAFGHPETHGDALTLIGGILLGSIIWWLLLSGGIALIRDHFTEKRIVMVNRVTATVLAILGVWAVFSGVEGFLKIYAGRSIG